MIAVTVGSLDIVHLLVVCLGPGKGSWIKSDAEKIRACSNQFSIVPNPMEELSLATLLKTRSSWEGTSILLQAISHESSELVERHIRIISWYVYIKTQ